MSTNSEMTTIQTLLTRPSALAALPADALTALSRRLYPCHFTPGETIIRQGHTDKDLYLLGRGEARVTVQNRTGEEVEVGRLHPGDVFGEWSLLTNRPRAATVAAVSEVDAYILHKEDYEIVLDSYLSLVQYLMRALSIRQREYAGLLAAELNLWASAYGGMNKDQILTVSFLSVAAAPSAHLKALLSSARFRLWAMSLEGAAGQPARTPTGVQAEIQERLAAVRGTGREQGPEAAFASIVEDLSTYPTFDLWRQSWLAQVESGVEDFAKASAIAGDGQEPAVQLAAAYLATMHIILDAVSSPELIDRYTTLDQQAARTISAASQLQGTVSRLRAAQRRPGYPVPDAGAREGRRAIERQLQEIERTAKALPKSARDSTSAVITITQLLAEYFLRLNEMRPRSAALPYSI